MVEKNVKSSARIIFDEAKAAHNGNSFAAKAALLEIRDAVGRYNYPDALLRKKHIAQAWNGIGDAKCTWIDYSCEILPKIPPSNLS